MTLHLGSNYCPVIPVHRKNVQVSHPHNGQSPLAFIKAVQNFIFCRNKGDIAKHRPRVHGALEEKCNQIIRKQGVSYRMVTDLLFVWGILKS